METADRTSILQPVLQWNGSDEGENRGWVIASYFVNGQPGELKVLAKTQALAVSPGAVLDATIRFESKEHDIFRYSCNFGGISGSGLHIESRAEFVQAGLALEVSNVTGDSELPASAVTHFQDVEIILDDGAKPSPVWEIINPAIKYGVRAIPIFHNGVQSEVDVYYR